MPAAERWGRGLKWAAVVTTLTSTTLTSFNIYPVNLFAGLTGAILWVVGGILMRDYPVAIEGAAASVVLAFGIFHWWTS